LINLNDIKTRSAIGLLEKYSGINPYLKKLRNDYLKNNKVALTEVQTKYIIENHDKQPIPINKIIKISTYLGDELKKQDNLSFVPEKMLVEYVLAETDKTFHIYGKLNQKQESKMYWIPKTQILDDLFFDEIKVDVDFTKYNDVLAKQNKKLFKHQEEGIKFLLSRDECIMADDMGLAKTLQAIIAALETNFDKILVICPSSLKINWQREIGIYTNDSIIIVGRKWQTAKFTIINFDILKNFHTVENKKDNNEIKELNRQIVNSKFDLIIVDEAHNLKNNKSIRGEIVADLSINFGIKKIWLLTGTPVANRPMDFFNLLRIIKAPIADDWHFFAKRYCDGKKFFKILKNGKKKQIFLTNGASNLDELNQKTKNFIIRRLKEDVLDMPEKMITPVYHQLSEKGWKEYDMLWDEYLEKRKKEKKKGAIDRDLVELGLLRKFIAMEAIPHTIEIVENAIESGSKVIIFTNFNDELNELADYFGKLCVCHNGSMNNTEKQYSVDSFQNNPNIKVFIGNIKSAGVGITLTASNIVVFNSFDWVTGNNEQCEDRAHRLGQRNNVTIYYQLFEDTVSIRMWGVLKNKKEIISTIIGDKKLSESEITDLLMQNIIDEFAN
jgi:SWI/SNF-related matrix-associated actin-dependent regulator 1 of chromatin subfamily A